jgi:hypothetical protein
MRSVVVGRRRSCRSDRRERAKTANRPKKCEECGGATALDERAAKLAALTFPENAYCFDCLLIFIDQEGMGDPDRHAPLIQLSEATSGAGSFG